MFLELVVNVAHSVRFSNPEIKAEVHSLFQVPFPPDCLFQQDQSANYTAPRNYSARGGICEIKKKRFTFIFVLFEPLQCVIGKIIGGVKILLCRCVLW